MCCRLDHPLCPGSAAYERRRVRVGRPSGSHRSGRVRDDRRHLGASDLRRLGQPSGLGRGRDHLGPVVAMVIAHIFAASLVHHAALRRGSTKRELLRIVRRESRFLLVCVPQIVLPLVLTLAGLSLNNTVLVLIWASAASLGFWGWAGMGAPAYAEWPRSSSHDAQPPTRRARARWGHGRLFAAGPGQCCIGLTRQ
jgi:hypothetical protein